jgi:flagellar FliJ protein
MKRFIFRLDRLLSLRSRAEREQARALAGALREEEARRAALAEAAARLDRSCNQMAEAAGSVARAGTLCHLGLAMARAAESVRSAEETHQEAVDCVEAEQDRFGQARKDKRVIERLRERRSDSWRAEVERHEQREMDSVARQRHARGGRP